MNWLLMTLLGMSYIFSERRCIVHNEPRDCGLAYFYKGSFLSPAIFTTYSRMVDDGLSIGLNQVVCFSSWTHRAIVLQTRGNEALKLRPPLFAHVRLTCERVRVVSTPPVRSLDHPSNFAAAFLPRIHLPYFRFQHYGTQLHSTFGTRCLLIRLGCTDFISTPLIGSCVACSADNALPINSSRPR